MSNGGLQFDEERAREMVDCFVGRFDESYRALACHAALPLALTPELLNYLRTRFLFGQVPWVAEADLLLSELCREVGYELYAMDAGVRSYLVVEMQNRFGVERMQEVARLLIRYVRHLARTSPSRMAHELQAQQWSALVYLDDRREQTVRELAEQIRKCVEGDGESNAEGARINRSEMSRLARLIQELAHQLSEYPELIRYARLTTRILGDTKGSAAESFHEESEFTSGSTVAGVTLPALETVARARTRVIQKQAATLQVRKRWALVVGISDYSKDYGRTLQGSENARMMRDALTALGYEVICLYDQSDTTGLDPNKINVELYLKTVVENAKSDDLLLVYFSGLTGFYGRGETSFLLRDLGMITRIRLSTTRIRLSEIVNAVTRSEARRQVVIFDLVRIPSSIPPTSFPAGLEGAGKNIVMISCNFNDKPDRVNHKNLTDHIIDALKNTGQAQIKADSVIEYLREAFAIEDLIPLQTMNRHRLEIVTEGDPASIILADRPLESPATEQTSDAIDYIVNTDIDSLAKEADNLRESASRDIVSGNLEAACKGLEEALSIYRNLNDKPREADTLLQLSEVLTRLELKRDAIESLQRAAKIGDETGNWRLVAKALWHMAGTEIELKEYDSAESHLRRILEIDREQKDPDAEVATLRQLASLYQILNRYSEAHSILQDALRIKQTAEDARGAAMVLSDMARLHVEQGDFPRAISYFEQALKVFIELEDRNKTGLLLGDIGRTYLRAGEPEQAINYHNQALQIYQETGNRQEEGHALIEIGLDYSASSNRGRAVEYFEQSLRLFREIDDAGGEYDALTNLGLLYERSSNLNRALEVYEQQLEVARRISESREMRSLINLGMLHERLGGPDRAIDSYEQALAIARKIENKRDETNILSRMGDVFQGTGQYRIAAEYYEQSLAVARDAADTGSEIRALGEMANAHKKRGELEKAIDYYEQMATAARKVADWWNEVYALNELGSCYREKGETRAAISYHWEATTTARRANNPALELSSLERLGDAYAELSDWSKVIEYYEQALNIARQVENKSSESYILRSIGYAHLMSGDIEKAIEYDEQSLSLASSIEDKASEWSALANLGSAYVMKQEPQRAIEYYNRALDLTRHLNDRQGERYLFSSLGSAYKQSGDMQMAAEYYQQTLVLTRELGDRKSEINALNDLGLVYASMSDPFDSAHRAEEFAQRAIEHFQQALRISRETGDTDAEERTLGLISSLRNEEA